tara:strand:+ start:3881 stop:4102 length:222 start_codon:yes stop_codon:yes gene_type:complete
MENILYAIGGTGLFFAGMFQAGKLSARYQIKELQELKEALIESNIEHDNLVHDIDIQLDKLKHFDFSLFVKNK